MLKFITLNLFHETSKPVYIFFHFLMLRWDIDGSNSSKWKTAPDLSWMIIMMTWWHKELSVCSYGPGMGVTKAPLVYFSVMGSYDSVKV